jgi:hypothetical protein
LKLALVGYGHVGKTFGRLLERQRAAFPFRLARCRRLAKM